MVAVSACGPERVVLPRPSPSVSGAPTATPTTGATTAATPTRTATAAPTTAAPATAAPSPTGAASPGSTPATACPERTGGATANQAQLTAIRIAHNPGFDRVVFEFGPSTAPGGVYGMPDYRIAVATIALRAERPAGPDRRERPVRGAVPERFDRESADGARSYTGPHSLKPTTTPLVKEVRLVEDFERVLVWGIGLQRLAMPHVLTLSGPSGWSWISRPRPEILRTSHAFVGEFRLGRSPKARCSAPPGGG